MLSRIKKKWREQSWIFVNLCVLYSPRERRRRCLAGLPWFLQLSPSLLHMNTEKWIFILTRTREVVSCCHVDGLSLFMYTSPTTAYIPLALCPLWYTQTIAHNTPMALYTHSSLGAQFSLSIHLTDTPRFCGEFFFLYFYFHFYKKKKMLYIFCFEYRCITF